MACRPIRVGWPSILACVLWASPGAAADPDAALQRWVAARVPLAEVPAGLREQVRQVLEEPTVFGHGPSEVFSGRPALYRWLLDHPDRGAEAWRRLGAKCLAITDRGEGRFGWAEGQGSDVWWQTVYQGPQMRVWYAQGQVRPAPLLPLVPVRAVVVLRHLEGAEDGPRALIHHQASIFVQTDSKAAVTVARLLGASMPRLAEQCLAQMELFFSGLVWYADKHPERTVALGLPAADTAE